MAVNLDKPAAWKADIKDSVEFYNHWFLEFAPQTYRDTRKKTVSIVEAAMKATQNFLMITPQILKKNPGILSTLRMVTCPPIARDRLIGLADANKNLVLKMENGELPPRMSEEVLLKNLKRICETLSQLLDVDILPWLSESSEGDEESVCRAATIVADRLCGAQADPIIRNAQEARQLDALEKYFRRLGYEEYKGKNPMQGMEPGKFCFRKTILGAKADNKAVNLPIDAIVKPEKSETADYPILIEAKSAGDFTNTNKRRKEEATKMNQLKKKYGEEIQFILFLCGYFDAGYLGYEAAEGIDWVWEHRIADLRGLGI